MFYAGKLLQENGALNRPVSIYLVLLFLFGLFGVARVQADEGASNIQIVAANCGFDLKNLKPLLGAAEIQAIPNSGISAKFPISIKSGPKILSGNLEVACAHLADDTSTIASFPDAKSVIIDEDSGGRYYRHVAFERSIQADGWQASVAFVDYTLGDTQRTKVNDFVACDERVLRPCIDLHFSEHEYLSRNDVRQILEAIRKISVAPR